MRNASAMEKSFSANVHYGPVEATHKLDLGALFGGFDPVRTRRTEAWNPPEWRGVARGAKRFRTLILEMLGGKNVKSARVRCLSRGDDCCASVVTWDRV